MSDWPNPGIILPLRGETFSAAFGSDFRDEFRFQLGRLYALAGQPTQARVWLRDAMLYPDNAASKWSGRAYRYLKQLNNPPQAEQALIADYAAEEKPADEFAQDPVLQAAEALFSSQSPQSALAIVRAALSSTDATCKYGPYYCAALYYMAGLAYEAQGKETQAVAAYWHLWQVYPESLYAVIVRHRLEPRL